MTPQDITEHFSSFGQVNFVKLIYETIKETGERRSKGYGFLYMHDAAGDAAVQRYMEAHQNRIEIMGKSRVFINRHDASREMPLQNRTSHDLGFVKIPAMQQHQHQQHYTPDNYHHLPPTDSHTNTNTQESYSLPMYPQPHPQGYAPQGTMLTTSAPVPLSYSQDSFPGYTPQLYPQPQPTVDSQNTHHSQPQFVAPGYNNNITYNNHGIRTERFPPQEPFYPSGYDTAHTTPLLQPYQSNEPYVPSNHHISNGTSTNSHYGPPPRHANDSWTRPTMTPTTNTNYNHQPPQRRTHSNKVLLEPLPEHVTPKIVTDTLKGHALLVKTCNMEYNAQHNTSCARVEFQNSQDAQHCCTLASNQVLEMAGSTIPIRATLLVDAPRSNTHNSRGGFNNNNNRGGRGGFRREGRRDRPY